MKEKTKNKKRTKKGWGKMRERQQQATEKNCPNLWVNEINVRNVYE